MITIIYIYRTASSKMRSAAGVCPESIYLHDQSRSNEGTISPAPDAKMLNGTIHAMQPKPVLTCYNQ